MGTNIGLWIDHRKAVVVALTEAGEEISKIKSDVEKQLRRAGDSPLQGNYEPRQVPSDNSRQRYFTGQLNSFYDAVIAHICDGESILIVGPGQAKDELNERLGNDNLGGRVVVLETVDKMTDRQIVAKIRQHFAR